MPKKKEYFGTDGIRGRVGQFPINAEFVLKLGWAAGKVFSRNTKRAKVLIGKDTRISGYMFESALEAGLSAAGVDIHLLGPMPTPAIAYLTRTLRAQAGIVISASHNAYADNGIKFFSAEGTKLPDSVEWEIEEELAKTMETVESSMLGKASRVNDAQGRYIEFCKSTFPTRMNLRGIKIVLDCAHGATYSVAPHVFEELGADVIVIGNKPNGTNINDGYGSTKPDTLVQRVIKENAALGIAFDGDGDRVVMVDARGELVDGDELVYIIARDHLQDANFAPGIVGTQMSNLGLELALAELGLEFVRTQVGDRHVMAELEKRQWQIGGESSGHIICLHATTTGDGIVSALQVLKAMVSQQLPLHQLKHGMEKFPQVMINVKAEKLDKGLLTHPTLTSAVNDAEQQLAGKGRVLLRASGTEPVVRVMVEGQEAQIVNMLAQQLASVVNELMIS